MNLNIDFVHFLVVTAFSFLVGLEVKSYRNQYITPQEESLFFGDVRTYSFVGILGFILFIIDSNLHILYASGFLSITVLYALLYYKNLQENQRSILLYIVMLLVYSFGSLIQIQPLWMTALLYVSIVFILNINKGVEKFTHEININEFETLSKMILLSVVILPLLPDTKTIPYIPLSPFKIWLAVVVISGISYSGYILQKYFFPSKGYYLTGIFGGSYSSTATTVVLARKAKQIQGYGVIDAAIISATSVMYLRLIIIALIFNMDIGKNLIIPFVTLSLIGFLISLVYLRNEQKTQEHVEIVDRNPLELKTAFLFAFLFVAMIVLTHFVTKHYGTSGLEILSFVVGFTDIDPFILSILTGKFSIVSTQITAAIMIAAGSNNLLKAIYAIWFGGIKNTFKSALWISILGIITIVWGLYFEHII
ncbi:MgtC/SapB family protein [Sulfurimonas sp.]